MEALSCVGKHLPHTLEPMTLHKMMIKIVYDVLEKHAGNKTRAANELGITPRTLRSWVRCNDELSHYRVAAAKRVPKKQPGVVKRWT